MGRAQKSLGFQKKTQATEFSGFYWVLGITGFLDFYLHEQLGSLLVDLAHQLSFYLDSPVLIDYLKICNYWSLETVDIKKTLITTGIMV